MGLSASNRGTITRQAGQSLASDPSDVASSGFLVEQAICETDVATLEKLTRKLDECKHASNSQGRVGSGEVGHALTHGWRQLLDFRPMAAIDHMPVVNSADFAKRQGNPITRGNRVVFFGGVPEKFYGEPLAQLVVARRFGRVDGRQPIPIG